MEHKKIDSSKQDQKGKLNHVGGIADDVGGIDPDIDENLMRLSGGP